MTETVLCLDSSVFIKFLLEEAPESQVKAASALITRATLSGAPMVAPAFAWAEVGSVLRKKVRQGVVTQTEAASHWSDFLRLPVQYFDAAALRQRAWWIGAEYDLPTLYDAAFLACTELAPAAEGSVREFWTADKELLRRLGNKRPEYVRELA